ncbi:isoflavone 3'-hydroxylase-like [Momordica charantia]|uniref:Isoflavone 3'-hydroxylase-like n=1 Tax=Momordica charantia TaxID=3673 RepID=A0A6J1D797_MOMCH|nr:isoflavone 3'-hydroxylase-like [Momordica charantia]
MEFLLLSILSSLFSLLIVLSFLPRPRRGNLPPSPPFALPLIGHIHLVKHPVHRTFHKISKKFGPIFSLRFGSRLIVVVSSSSAVQECFTKNDIVLANRPIMKSGKYLAYNYTTLGSSPYGEHWRNLRRISALEVLSTSRLNSFVGIREDEIKRLMHRLCGDSLEEFAVVEVEPLFLDLTFSIVMRMLAGKKYYGDDMSEDSRQSRKFREVVTQILAHAVSWNPGDFIPMWNLIDPSGLEKRIMKLGQRADELFQGLIDEIRNQNNGGNTMIDHLLGLQNTQPEYYSDQVIKGIIQDIILAGIDTSAVTIEWALSHLLNNPDVLKKARTEIDYCIGQERMVNEADLSSLSYLQGIISETLRLTPTGPILIPHCASEDCKVEGYDIPRDTIVLVNAWAIHRDPNLWEDAKSFKPERHTNAIRPNTYELLPFGVGRRACPGMGMAQRVVGLTLASLIQCFEWKRVSSSLVDMTEGEGTTMPKAQPLIAKCKPHPIMKVILSKNN